MSRNIAISIGAILCVILVVSCGWVRAEEVFVPNVVTADIQAGIEKYIEDEAAKDGGYFKFSSDGKEYLFKLVRVHT